jgi:hypothetical protein
VINPFGNFKILSELTKALCVLINCFAIPTSLAFGTNIYEMVPEYILKGSFLYLIFDIVISLNTGFYDKGILIDDRIDILYNFLNEEFLLEITTLTPLFVLYYTVFFDFYPILNIF